MDMQQQPPQHIANKKRGVYWDWWRENPVELLLVLFIIVLFMAVPWEGCGMTEQEVEADHITVVP